MYSRTSRREGRADKKSERKDYEKIQEIAHFSFIDLYNTETILEEKGRIRRREKHRSSITC
jgi:hypothetical protein